MQGVLPATTTNGGGDGDGVDVGGSGGDRSSPGERLDDIGQIQTAIDVAKKAGLSLPTVARWNESLLEISQNTVEELIVLDTDETLDNCGLGGRHAVPI